MSTPADIFSRLGGDIVDPPIVMPASQPLAGGGAQQRAASVSRQRRYLLQL